LLFSFDGILLLELDPELIRIPVAVESVVGLAVLVVVVVVGGKGVVGCVLVEV